MARPPGTPDGCPKALARFTAILAGLTWAVCHLAVRVHRRRK